MHESLFFTLNFSFHTIFSDTTSTSLWAPQPIKYWLNIFVLLAICLQAKKQRDPVIPSGDKCDQRILKSTWLKAFAAISQDQEFPQIWDFYGELDSNISFYMTTFPAKINHKTFQNKRRTLFWVNFVHILSFLPKGNFS